MKSAKANLIASLIGSGVVAALGSTLLLVTPVSALRFLDGDGLEPAADVFIILTAFSLLSLAIVIPAELARKKTLSIYVASTAVLGASIMLAVSLADDYFTGPGISWPGVGFGLLQGLLVAYVRLRWPKHADGPIREEIKAVV